MPNRNKEKGDRFQRAALLTAHEEFPDAWITRAGWDDDRGDIVLCRTNPFVIQAKDCGDHRWGPWLDGLDEQVKNADAEFGALCVKRRGIADAGEALAVMRYRNLLRIVRRLT